MEGQGHSSHMRGAGGGGASGGGANPHRGGGYGHHPGAEEHFEPPLLRHPSHPPPPPPDGGRGGGGEMMYGHYGGGGGGGMPGHGHHPPYGGHHHPHSHYHHPPPSYYYPPPDGYGPPPPHEGLYGGGGGRPPPHPTPPRGAGVSMRGRRRGGSSSGWTSSKSSSRSHHHASRGHSATGAPHESIEPVGSFDRGQDKSNKSTPEKKKGSTRKDQMLGMSTPPSAGTKSYELSGVGLWGEIDAGRPVKNRAQDSEQQSPLLLEKTSMEESSSAAFAPNEEDDDDDDDYKEGEEEDDEEEEEDQGADKNAKDRRKSDLSDTGFGSMDEDDLLMLDDPALAQELAEELKFLLQDSEETDDWLDSDKPMFVLGEDKPKGSAAAPPKGHVDGVGTAITSGSNKFSLNAKLNPLEKGPPGTPGTVISKGQKASRNLRQLCRPPSPTVTTTVYESTTPLQKTANNRGRAGMVRMLPPQDNEQVFPLQHAVDDNKGTKEGSSSTTTNKKKSKGGGTKGGKSQTKAHSKGVAPLVKLEDKELARIQAETSEKALISNTEARQRRDVSSLLVQFHQIVTQQAVLAMRKANMQKKAIFQKDKGGNTNASGGSNNKGSNSQLGLQESPDDLALILDSAVGMLQELDELRKDGIRNALWYEEEDDGTSIIEGTNEGDDDDDDGDVTTRSARKLKKKDDETKKTNKESVKERTIALTSVNKPESTIPTHGRGVLTRAAFMKMLDGRYERMIHTSTTTSDNKGTFSRLSLSSTNQQRDHPLRAGTVFDIKGLARLKEVFKVMDDNVSGKKSKEDFMNIIEPEDNAEACERLLRLSESYIDHAFLPGRADPSQLLTDAREVFGEDFLPPLMEEQVEMLMKEKDIFTAGEDNLVRRGVNSFGEKQWHQIADRVLPERSKCEVSHRYAKLCFLMYKANGIKIDERGILEDPPEVTLPLKGSEEKKLRAIGVVAKPAKCSVNRWSVAEDIAILKAVPILGRQWAEISCRVVPHRSRGHLRKRYQVLERRVAATVRREHKSSEYQASTTATSSKSKAGGGGGAKSKTKSRTKNDVAATSTTSKKVRETSPDAKGMLSRDRNGDVGVSPRSPAYYDPPPYPPPYGMGPYGHHPHDRHPYSPRSPYRSGAAGTSPGYLYPPPRSRGGYYDMPPPYPDGGGGPPPYGWPMPPRYDDYMGECGPMMGGPPPFRPPPPSDEDGSPMDDERGGRSMLGADGEPLDGDMMEGGPPSKRSRSGYLEPDPGVVGESPHRVPRGGRGGRGIRHPGGVASMTPPTSSSRKRNRDGGTRLTPSSSSYLPHDLSVNMSFHPGEASRVGVERILHETGVGDHNMMIGEGGPPPPPYGPPYEYGDSRMMWSNFPSMMDGGSGLPPEYGGGSRFRGGGEESYSRSMMSRRDTAARMNDMHGIARRGTRSFDEEDEGEMEEDEEENYHEQQRGGKKGSTSILQNVLERAHESSSHHHHQSPKKKNQRKGGAGARGRPPPPRHDSPLNEEDDEEKPTSSDDEDDVDMRRGKPSTSHHHHYHGSTAALPPPAPDDPNNVDGDQQHHHDFMVDGFDPVKALQSLSNPASPEFTKQPRSKLMKESSRGKSLYASAIEAVAHEEAATTASGTKKGGSKRKKRKTSSIEKTLF